MVADFDFRGMADMALILVFSRLILRPKFINALASLVMSLCNAASKCLAKAVSSAKSKSRTSTVLTLVLVRRRATLKSLPSGKYGGTLRQESKT